MLELLEKKGSMYRDVDQVEREPGSVRNQSSFAYQAIRSGILSGRFAPDQKLKVQDLASDLRVSPGAVREALSRLVPEQMVVSRDQRGFVVAPLSIEDLVDLTELRCDIEALALKRSLELGDANWEADLIAAAHRLVSLPPVHSPEWVSLHAAFHTALVSACGSRRLLSLHAQLYEQSERYRGLSGRFDVKRDVRGEHQAIVELALKRDAYGLIKETTDHIRRTTKLIVQARSAIS